MLKIKIFQKLGILLAILTVGLSSASISLAAYQPKARNVCALSVHPFNSSATGSDILGPYDSSWFNIFNQDSGNCTNHLQFPNQYTPQDPLRADNPLVNKPGIENKSAPVTQHNHAYYNDSVEDANYYYKSFIDKFQITLKPDALSNTDIANLVCMTPTTGSPIELVGCNGHVNAWGGTNISFDKNTGVITWDFGVDSNPKKGRPIIYGNNPGLNWVPGMPNTTIDDNRVFEPAVKLISKDNKTLKNKDIWSASTSSQVLLRDQAILKSSVNKTAPNYGNLLNVSACANDGQANSSYDYTHWCTLPTPTASQINGVLSSQVVDGKSYYWFRIGMVGTTWQTPPTITNICTDLKLTWTPSSNQLKENTPVTFHVEPTFSNPNVPAPKLNYLWNAGPNPLSNFEVPSGNSNNPYSNFQVTTGNSNPLTNLQVPTGNNNNPLSNLQVPTGNNNPLSNFQVPTQQVNPLSNFTLQQTSYQPNVSKTGEANFLLAANNVPPPNHPVDPNQPVGVPPGSILPPPLPANAGTNLFADSSSANDFANPYTEKTDKDTYYTGGPGGTRVTVQAVGQGVACSAQVDIPKPPPVLACLRLNAKPAGSTLQVGVPITIQAAPMNTDNSAVPQVTWTKTGGGTFANIPGSPAACVNAAAAAMSQPANTSVTFNAPSTCEYIFTAAEDSVLTLEANPNNGNVSACKQVYTAQKQPPPPGQACLDLKITNPGIHNGILDFTPGQALAVDFNLAVQTDPPNYPLEYKWTESPVTGTFDGKKSPYLDEDTTAHYINTNPKDGTVISVQAWDRDGVPQSLCKDTVTLKSKQVPPPVCDDSQFLLVSSNGNPLKETQPSVLLASGKRTDGSSIDQMTYTTTGGTLVPQGTCSNQPSGQTVTVTATCPVLFTGGPQGTVVTVSSVPPEAGNICKRNLTVIGSVIPPPPVCQYLNIIPQGNNSYCVQTNPAQYNGQVVWTAPGSYTLYNGNQCIQLSYTPTSGTLSASVPGQPSCQAQLPFGPTPPPPVIIPPPIVPPPTIQKDVKFANATNGQYNTILNMSYNWQNNLLQYRIRFTPNGLTTTTLTDTISGGQIPGQYPNQFQPGAGTPLPGHIEYRDNMQVSVPHCDDAHLDTAFNCYTGDISTGLKLIKVSSPVTITYLAEIVNSAITQDNCNKGLVCEEIYKNIVHAPYITYDSSGLPVSICYDSNGNQIPCEVTSNDVRLQLFCQYILTRAAGDVYLEQDLTSGIDIYKCTNYKTTTGVLVAPAPESVPIINSTGAGETVTIGHEVCSLGEEGKLNDKNLENLYGKDTSNLSSQICEVKLRPGSSWQKSAITNSIDENKTRISRWEPNLPPGSPSAPTTLTSIAQTAQAYPSANGVYHIKGNLVIDPRGQDFAQDGDGANTIIVEDGDLTIKNNITIGSGCSKNACNLRDTASLAFIVLNGNIYVDKGVTDLAGVYFVQQGDAGTGKLISGTKQSPNVDSDKGLTVLGSIYGDIQPLFQHRLAAGDPSLGEGATVIRFDERIILNTPPGLQDIVDIKQDEVAR